MKFTLGLLSLLGFSLSLVVHGLALFGIDVQTHVPEVWALHVGIFVVFIPMVLQLNSGESKSNPLAMFSGLPAWAVASMFVLMGYVVINFFVSLGPSMVEGDPKLYEGAFALVKKGTFIRYISETEYHSRLANIARGFSGHWLIFYFVPFTHFWLRRKNVPANS